MPAEAAHAELDAIAHKYGRQFKPQLNASIKEQINLAERYFMTTTAQCDCGTPLGAHLRGRSLRRGDSMDQRKRLRLKGWSEAKIDRSLQQKQEHLSLHEQANATANSEAMESWVAFICEVLNSGKTSSVALLLHMYDGSVEDHIQLMGREIVHTRDVSAEILGNMKEDVLYEFQA
ncbi:hypothetical protein B0E48_14490 [Rhodanobacter sp. C03]|nr:hypothetical protein B0E48_14490 [Rhodanobacter sp. C03]